MNLNNNPTKEELKALLQKQDDMAGDHALWVDLSGEVHIDLLLAETESIWRKEMDSKCTFRYETYGCQKGYVGEEVANDEDYVSMLLKELISDWQAGRRGYLDFNYSLFEK